ncbi:MAG TPA: helix-turn-helix transcriptional regulator [Streptosporangiaceae bacterium]
MSDPADPTLSGRRLALELRRLRDHVRLTGTEAAERLGWSESKISRIELHRTGVKKGDLERLLDLYEVTDPHRGELLALAKEARVKSELGVATAGFPSDYTDYLRAEAEARSVWNWEPLIVPGLLQTEEYARAVFRGWQAMFAVPPGDGERRAQTRQVRRQALTRESPLELSVVIDESVLYRRFGGKAVMREQFELLIKDSALPNVDVRILPLEGDHPIGTGAFSFMQFPPSRGVPLPDRVSVEHLEDSHYLDVEEETHRYRVAFEHLIANSHDPGKSRDLIARVARDRWT